MIQPQLPHRRRSIRLRGHDYSSRASYYVTICAFDRQHIFGRIERDKMVLSDFGRVVADRWQWLGSHFEGIVLDEWVVMPNHLHGIVVYPDTKTTETGRGGSRAALAPSTIVTDRRKPLGGLIGAFKTVTTKEINQLRQALGSVVWQRDFWDHIIRDDLELESIRSYIAGNVANWETDDLNVLERTD